MKKTKQLICALALLFAACSTTAQQSGSGYALGFNGTSNYVDCGKISLTTGDFSAEAWINLKNASSLRGVFGSWVLGTPFPAYFYIIYGLNGPNVLTGAFHVNDGSSSNTYVNCAQNLLNEWHHVALTCKRTGRMTLYLDGVARDSVDISFAVGKTIDNPNPAVKFQIGTVGSQTAYFNGDIDEVRLWTKALSATEVRQRMCSKLIGNEANLKAYWRLDEGAGNTIFDSSISGYNGTLY